MLTLPELISLPSVAVRLPVLVIVTLPPPTCSRPTVALVVTWGEPVSSVVASPVPGADGDQLAPVLNSLSEAPVWLMKSYFRHLAKAKAAPQIAARPAKITSPSPADRRRLPEWPRPR